MLIHRSMILNPARAWKARAGFGHERRENPSCTTNNDICIFSHPRQHKHMQQSKTCPFERKYVRNLWNVMWRIPRYDFPGIVHLIADECWSARNLHNKAIRDGRPRPPRHQCVYQISSWSVEKWLNYDVGYTVTAKNGIYRNFIWGSELRHRSILETITHRPKCQIQKL